MDGVRICSFNIMNFGENSTIDRFLAIRDIIKSEKIDIVAFQEVLRGNDNLVPYVRNYMQDWDARFCLPPETKDREKQGDKRGEGYVFAWDTKRFSLAETEDKDKMRVFEPTTFGSSDNNLHVDCKRMIRAPLYGRFIPQKGFYELRLISVHLYYGDQSKKKIEARKAEYNTYVDEVYPTFSKKRYGNNRYAYTVAMGDYNLNLKSPKTVAAVKESPSAVIVSDKRIVNDQVIATVQDELTTVSKENNGRYVNNYDHFTYSTSDLERTDDRCEVWRIDAVHKYYEGSFENYFDKVSDHVPIIYDLYIGEEEPRYDNYGYRKTN